jgi:hypothetical protein
VLRTREQTLGTAEAVEDRTTDATEIWVRYRSSTTTFVDDSSAGTPPDCAGTFYTTQTPDAPIIYSAPPGPAGPGTLRTYVGTLTFRVGFVGRIVAMAYHGDSETAGEVKMDAQTVGTITLSDVRSESYGVTINHNDSSWDTISPTCELGQGYPATSYLTDISAQDISGESTGQVTLTMPGGAVITSPMRSSVVGGLRKVFNDDDFTHSDLVSTAEVTMQAGDRTVSFNERHQNGVPKMYWTPSDDSVSWTNGDVAPALNTQLWAFVPFLNQSLSLVVSQSDGFFCDSLYLVPKPPGTFASTSHGLSYFKTQLRRYANKLFEFEAVEFFRLADGSDQPLRTIQMGAAGTGGSQNQTLIHEEGTPVPAYGSHNPVTGEIKRAQALPVVYI